MNFFSVFWKIANCRNEENYIILLVREARSSYLSMNIPRVGEHFKKCVGTKISLIFY